jgi:hypothetical protein
MPNADAHAAGLDRAAEALAKYAEPLLREVAARLIRPRNTWPAEEVRDRLIAALPDPVLIDRTLRELSPAARKLLRLVGISRQPLWRIRGLLDLLAALGHGDGIVAVQELLAVGLLFPDLPPGAIALTSFDAWLKQLTTHPLSTFALPLAATRAKGEDLMLPELPTVRLSTAVVQEGDGLEWPMRIAVLWQTARGGPLRRTQQGGFFKRDLDRLRGHPLLSSPPGEAVASIPDPDLLALLLALEEGVLIASNDQIAAGSFPPSWSRGTHAAAAGLFAGLPGLALWHPVAGWAEEPAASRWVAPIAVLSLALVASAPVDAWVRVADVEGWVGTMTEAEGGTAEALLLGVMHQLRIVQAAKHKNDWYVRVAPLGRALADGTKTLPPDRPAVEQTLIVQPNLEIVLFRQGLTPALVARLSRVAVWKTLGLACTLQLTAESVYHGLEAGETLADLVALFERHGTRGLSETVLGTLRSWASKRERVMVYPAAMLLEFRTVGDLDRAIRQGLVERRVTDRIGLIASEEKISYGQFRLVGTRDYLAPEERCADVEDDGLTLAVNDNRSDLLLDSEVRRFAEPVPAFGLDERPRYRMSPETLRTAREQGVEVRGLDGWFRRRTGGPLPPAARLLLTGHEMPPLELQRLVILRVPSADVADGLMAWPETLGLIAERLSPTALVVSVDAIAKLRAKLAEIGVPIA